MPPPAEPVRAVGVYAVNRPTQAAGSYAASRPMRAPGADSGRTVWLTLAGAYRANGGRWEGIARMQAAIGGRR